ncbi:MAG: pilus assembly protein, partial [Methylobacter sp.]|nr:pilus assembly protein [Methylobacter sp.]
ATASTTDNGLCYNGAVNEYSTAIWTTVSMTAAPSVAFGSITGATAIPNVSAQPRYIIEGLPGAGVYYRITARAQGINANTVVWLQSIYKP